MTDAQARLLFGGALLALIVGVAAYEVWLHRRKK